ncbi:hypothetical protein [Flavobacterium sp. HSC-61S13]|uniref:hypothetical protein n=1 Tax=Flavobacterium sp. HSC-61S13 TaxID=2910963 RepID=UPI00209FEDDE|nr:hypothetical protein [Flavobacterium sp. HSC-61S13]MCP1996027.1 hypothetical protein [Flavobacterium sp. HSC-61S13]
MKKINYYLAFFCAALFFISCSDDEGVVVPPSVDPVPGMVPPSATAFKNLQLEALEKMTQRKSFKAEEGIVFTSKAGVVLTIDPLNLFDTNDETVTGDVELEFIEFYDRAAMVLANRPLMGINEVGGLEPLVTGGQFFINVTQYGVGLRTNYYNMTVPAVNSGGLDQEMTMWKGNFSDDGNLKWDEFDPGLEGGGVFPNAETNEYQVYLRDFGWSNIDRFAGEEGEKAAVIVRVPDGYDNKNSSVYVTFKGETDVLAFLDQYDVATKSFTEHYGWGPVGYDMYVIFVSESQGKLIYAIQEVKLEKNKIITISMDELKMASEEELAAKIKSLP